MSPAAPKLRVGDVFSIPIDAQRVGYGQIVGNGEVDGQLYFAVFDSTNHADGDASLGRLLFLALSMDALLFHGHWKVVGHSDVEEMSFPWPAYKEGVSPAGSFDVVSHTGQERRPATEDEIAELPFRTLVAPIRLEKALRAFHGEELWDETYDALRPVPEGLTSANLLGIR